MATHGVNGLRERDALCRGCGDIKRIARRAVFCSRACSNKFNFSAKPGRAPSRPVGVGSRGGVKLDPYAARASRSPGLNEKARRRLLGKWRARHLTCAYCPYPVEQVDHIVPISRGGTNYEGNLQPICAACNARKGKRLHIEFVMWLASHPGVGGSIARQMAS